MSFGTPENETDSAGHWVTIPYKGSPVVKLFLPLGSDPDYHRPLSLFWQGQGKWAAVAGFFGSLKGIWGDLQLRDLSRPDPSEIDADDYFGTILWFMSQRHVFLEVESGEHKIDLWADIEVDSQGLTPEVGLAIDADLLKLPQMKEACVDLISQTIRCRKIRDEDVRGLMTLVSSSAEEHYAKTEAGGAQTN